MLFIFLSYCGCVAYLSEKDTETLACPAFKSNGAHPASSSVPGEGKTQGSHAPCQSWESFPSSHATSS